MSAFPQRTAKTIDAAIASWFAKYKAPGVIVGIWIPGKGAYVAARGTADRSTGAPMLVTDHMRIGSVTKTFTITLLLQLADRKHLNLDDPVAKYLPYVPNGKTITLRMLANMTAGIFNYTEDKEWQNEVAANPDRVWTPRELVNVGLGRPPYFAPGTGWHYSNTNTVLVGQVIEKILGQPFGTSFQVHLRPARLAQHPVADVRRFASTLCARDHPDGRR